MKKVINTIIIIVLVIVIAICGYYTFDWLFNTHEQATGVQKATTVVEEIAEEEVFNREAYNELLSINPDFVGYIYVDDGSISLPIVRPTEEEGERYYMRRDFYRGYNELGCLFIRPNADFDSDMNTTIYGHNVTYSPSLMFSPLYRFTSQERYDECHTLTIWWPEAEKHYVVTNAYRIDNTELESYDVSVRDWSSEAEFNSWIAVANGKNLITPVEKAQYGDKFVTLETCYQDGSTSKTIIIAKEVSAETY